MPLLAGIKHPAFREEREWLIVTTKYIPPYPPTQPDTNLPPVLGREHRVSRAAVPRNGSGDLYQREEPFVTVRAPHSERGV